MPFEEREIIDNYVDREALRGDLNWIVTMSDEEKGAAVDTIILDRAQFVVDAVAERLLKDRAYLHQKRSEFEEQIKDFDNEIAAIDAAFVTPSNDKSKANQVERRNQQLSKARYESEVEGLEEEKPFSIQFHGDLRRWVVRNSKEITQRYGKDSVSPFSRAASKLIDIVVRERYTPKTLKAPGGIEKIQEGDTITGIEVTNPEVFLAEMLNFRNFGPASSIILLCIADMQAEERQNSSS